MAEDTNLIPNLLILDLREHHTSIFYVSNHPDEFAIEKHKPDAMDEENLRRAIAIYQIYNTNMNLKFIICNPTLLRRYISSLKFPR